MTRRPRLIAASALALAVIRGGLDVADDKGWTPPDSGEKLPHAYGPLNLEAVVEVVPLEDLLSDGILD